MLATVPDAAAHAVEPARLLIELGVVVVGLASLGRLAHRFGFSTIPLYLVAGLAFGTGGVAPLQFSHEFLRVGSEIGVLAGLGLGAGAPSELGTLAAAYVLITAIVGPLLARRG